MSKLPTILDKGADRSILAHGALVACFCGMLMGVLAVRSYREETMLRTMPSVPATVLASKPVKGGFSVDIAFRRAAGGDLVDCRVQIGLTADRTDLQAGSIVHVVPRSDSCGEPAVVGPRDTAMLASASGAFLLISLIQGVLAAQSMVRARHASDQK